MQEIATDSAEAIGVSRAERSPPSLTGHGPASGSWPRDVDHRGMVQEAVEDGGGDHLVGEDLAPVAEAAGADASTIEPRS